MNSVILFTVYTGGGYIEVWDKLAEDTMNHAVEEVKASLEYCTRGEVSSKYRIQNFFFQVQLPVGREACQRCSNSVALSGSLLPLAQIINFMFHSPPLVGRELCRVAFPAGAQRA